MVAAASGSEPTTNGFRKHVDKDAFQKTLEKYDEERLKRLRSDGTQQYISLANTEKFKRFAEDPWYRPGQRDEVHARLISKNHHRVLVLGAGFGGLLFAIRLIQSGAFTPEDIVLVDSAGGFGGTWYWNRYPGLMCDVESYIYMPLLEETGHMPTERYASGNELREYAEFLVAKWKLEDRGLFRTTLTNLSWDDDMKQWNAQGIYRPDSQRDLSVALKADLVILASGLLNFPKLAGLPGIEDYQGKTFHTSRWNYEYTGGSPSNPELRQLTDKKVGIIGTGATAVQAVPQLARWAKELVVFQRTPSSVNRRDNCFTDPKWWKREIQARGAGWQRERMENFNAFLSNVAPLPEVNMVGDEWSKLTSYSALIGGPQSLHPEYLDKMQSLDFQHQEGVRSRVDEVVGDKVTADALKPWYAAWCKRPCFHDEYLQSFNEPNVKLVDTQGRGIERLTSRGVVVGNEEYDLDLIIFSTGFSLNTGASPGGSANMSVTGRGGKSMDDKWANGLSTLHGVVTRDFPNLFYPGVSQSGVAPNQTYVLDQLSTHVAYIISEALNQAKPYQKKISIEPTSETEEAWTREILKRTNRRPGVTVCTPSYLNGEGSVTKMRSQEEMINLARIGFWGEGIGGYIKVIEDWRAQGHLKGLDIVAE